MPLRPSDIDPQGTWDAPPERVSRPPPTLPPLEHDPPEAGPDYLAWVIGAAIVLTIPVTILLVWLFW